MSRRVGRPKTSHLPPAGDAKQRKNFFDFDEKTSNKARLNIDEIGRLPTYDAPPNRRSSVTIPDKLREQMRGLLGVESDDDYAVSTTLVALADYACKVIREEKRSVKVRKATEK